MNLQFQSHKLLCEFLRRIPLATAWPDQLQNMIFAYMILICIFFLTFLRDVFLHGEHALKRQTDLEIFFLSNFNYCTVVTSLVTPLPGAPLEKYIAQIRAKEGTKAFKNSTTRESDI